jgi:hypothetical protein
MTKLAIKGHQTRGNEVIELLEMLGGSNPHNYSADCESLCFHIGENTNSIYYDWVRDCYEDGNTLVFTLEEFLEKYPYKIGNKVDYIKYDDNEFSVYEIIGMVWTGTTIEYTLDSFGFTCLTKDIRLHKENNMNKFKSLNVETYLKVWDETEKGLEVLVNDRFELKEDNGKFYIVKKQPEYPKTFVECAKMLDCFGAAHIDGYKCELLESLQELLVCRNAYWKIAGEQMDLGKPWEPDYTDDNVKYIIGIHRNHLDLNCTIERNYILIFPSEEIRDEFYENFKNIIESVKELL